MKHSPFVRLHKASANLNPARLEAAYEVVLSELFKNQVWESGPTLLRRIPWTEWEQVKKDDHETLTSPGLYIWGVEDRPLYIGITKGSFKKRFPRYVGTKKSQCELARQFETALIKKGVRGLPPHVTVSKVRLNGSIRFAKEGIAKVWVALFPHAVGTTDEIRELERALIPVANNWNTSRGLLPLLNKQT